MLQRIKIIYENNKIWIYLIRHLLISMVFAATAILIDTGYLPLMDFIPSVFATNIDLARSILATLAGALLTITTFTFSTIMVVLTMYSSNFSPRVVENFLTDKVSIKVLGIFVGGFLYCITTLLFMRDTMQDLPVISATIGVIYSILCIIYFIKFIYTVSGSIQASKLINKLYLQAYEMIETGMNYRQKFERVDVFDADQFPESFDVHSASSGYLELINFEGIMDLIKNIDCKVVVRPCIGDYMAKNMNLFSVYYKEQSQLMDNFDKKLYNCLSLTSQRMALSDYKFSIQKIVEIALRAISPGINDPNTAIHCIKILGVLLSKISESDGKYTSIQFKDCKGKLVYEDFNFEKDLYDTFYQIIHYGKTDLSVVFALFEALKIIMLSCSESSLYSVKNFAKYLFERCGEYHQNDFDKLKLVDYINEIKSFKYQIN